MNTVAPAVGHELIQPIGYYVNSQTMKRRRQIGRPQSAKERPIAPMKTQKESETPRDPRARQESRASVEPESRYTQQPPPSAVARSSADQVTMAQRSYPGSAPSPRPASAQPPLQNDPRRPSNTQQYSNTPNPYIQATGQYPVQANIPQGQYPQYDTQMYDTAPPPYPSDTKSRGGGGGGGTQPSSTGTQGFQSLYATSGGPPRPNQGQRRGDRHDTR